MGYTHHPFSSLKDPLDKEHKITMLQLPISAVFSPTRITWALPDDDSLIHKMSHFTYLPNWRLLLTELWVITIPDCCDISSRRNAASWYSSLIDMPPVINYAGNVFKTAVNYTCRHCLMFCFEEISIPTCVVRCKHIHTLHISSCAGLDLSICKVVNNRRNVLQPQDFVE